MHKKILCNAPMSRNILWNAQKKYGIILMLFSHDHYTYIYTFRNILNTIRTSEDTSLENIPLTLFERVRKGYKRFYCVRGEFKTEQNCNILTLTLMAITAFLSRFPGLFNMGASLGHGPHSSIFSPTTTA